MTATSDTSGQSWENIHVVGTNGEVDQGGEDEAMHLPVDESGISESSMLRDIIVMIWFSMACKDELLVKLHIIIF